MPPAGSLPGSLPGSLRVLLVDDAPGRVAAVREGLEVAGHQVAAVLSSPLELLAAIESVRPDVIVIDTESPSRDVLENLFTVSRTNPRPIVMFASDSSGESIRAAVRVGVSAYIVDGIDAERVKSIVDVACARFEAFQALTQELAEANLKLAERKVIDRAKGILMKARGLDEEGAYRILRRMAMDKNRRIGEVAQSVVDMQDLLG